LLERGRNFSKLSTIDRVKLAFTKPALVERNEKPMSSWRIAHYYIENCHFLEVKHIDRQCDR
jgi:hypothetical protein